MFKPVVFLCLAAVALAKKKEMKPAAVPLTAAGRAIGGRFQDAIQTLQYMECLQTSAMLTSPPSPPAPLKLAPLPATRCSGTGGRSTPPCRKSSASYYLVKLLLS